ncbi:MAG: SPASM domain-containing protein, partial [Candidatus Omnitrophica bacterium]|nr:SPASM domain-containing protein [Candidatus Omnitrophota bacterium]
KRINILKAERKSRTPFINLQCTITKYNYRYLEQLLDVANEARANSLTFHNLIFITPEILDRQKEFYKVLSCSCSDWQGGAFEPEIDVEILHQKMKDILKNKHNFSIDFYPNFSYAELKDYYGNPYYHPRQYSGRCLSPWIVAYVFPDGHVRPCLNSTYSFGNVKEANFMKIWNSQEAIRFRKILKENKIFPACVRCTELYRY